MRTSLPIILAVIGLVGCESPLMQKRVAIDTSHEKAIYGRLKSEPVPLLETTPYDGDARRSDVFNEGFRNGWERAISGALLHGTFGTPTDLPKDLREAWSSGWKSGAKVGSQRWLAERKRQEEALGQPGGSANRSQPIRSDTNQTSAAAGSGR